MTGIGVRHEVTLVFDDGVVKTITAGTEQTVLEAALEGGVPIAYQCRGGSCGTCVGQVTAGAVNHIVRGASALTHRERAAGMALMCSSQATSPLQVELAYPEDWSSGTNAPRGQRTTVEAVEQLCPSVFRLDLLVEEDGDPFHFTPGQYLQVEVPGVEDAERSFSMVTGPDDLPRLSLMIRYLPGGVMSEYLRERCQVGDAVRVSGPYGTFVGRPHEGERHVMVAGGTGVAPLLSILDGLRAGPSGLPATEFIFGVADADQIFGLDEFELRRFWSKSLTVTLCAERAPAEFEGVVGTPIDGLRSISPTPSDRFYVSGPPGMVGAVAAFLADAGVEQSRIHTEQFTINEEATA